MLVFLILYGRNMFSLSKFSSHTHIKFYLINELNLLYSMRLVDNLSCNFL